MTAELARLLGPLVCEWTGFSPGTIRESNLRRTLDRFLQQGATPQDLVARARARDRTVVDAIQQAVTVGETYFFRNPAQFDFAAAALARSPAGQVRVWSAGCATGEEAYTLASFLGAALPPNVELSVLGTDLVEANILEARRGHYRQWSVRAAGPIRTPLFSEGYRVLEALKRRAEFQVHNILSSPPSVSFNLIFCRNVLVYFSPDAAAHAVANLRAALTEDGIVVFGPMDLRAIPKGLEPVGEPAAMAFRRRRAPQREPVPPAIQPVVRPPGPDPEPDPEPAAFHLKALASLEANDLARAEAFLREAIRRCPGYVPGLVELALMRSRAGDRPSARSLMRQALRRLDGSADGFLLAGPQPLPAGTYRAIAAEFLG